MRIVVVVRHIGPGRRPGVRARLDEADKVAGPPVAVVCGPSEEATVVALGRSGATTVTSVSCLDLGVAGDLHEVAPARLTDVHNRRACPAPIPAPARRHP